MMSKDMVYALTFARILADDLASKDVNSLTIHALCYQALLKKVMRAAAVHNAGVRAPAPSPRLRGV